MQVKHYAIIGACLVSIGAMVSAFPDWNEALKPAFIGGVIGVIGAQITALYTERPNENK